jgi:uncharacterized protein (DUF2147 family)
MKTISLAVLGLLATTGFAFAADPSGTWRLDNGKITVKVRQCGGEVCANIVGLKEPTYKDGTAKIDKYNKNAALRKRPLMGLAVLSNMKPTGDGTWAGNIYNADDGRTYDATMTMSGNTMKLKGCVAGIFCKTNTFKKVN